MNKNRVEAFSDGVIAILITIMVLELKVPHGASFSDLSPLLPVFVSYVLSFIYLGIYWNNHHHLFHACRQIRGNVLWANLLLLFWLSLVPFVTGWMGENHFARITVAAYGVVLLMAAISFEILLMTMLRADGPASLLRKAVGSDWKGKASTLIYVVAIPLAFVHPAIAGALYISVAFIWLIPDTRIERVLSPREG